VVIIFAALFTEFPGMNASEKIRKTEITSLTNISRNKRNSFFYVKCPQLVFMGKPYPENGLRFWRVDCSLGFKHSCARKRFPRQFSSTHPTLVELSRGEVTSRLLPVSICTTTWRINSSEFFSLSMILFYCCPKAYSIDILYTRSSLDGASLI